MSLHTATNPDAPSGKSHTDAPSAPSKTRNVYLRDDAEVMAVIRGERTLHLDRLDDIDRWQPRGRDAGGKLKDGLTYVVRSKVRRPPTDPMAPNQKPEPGPSERVVIVTADIVKLGDLDKTHAARLIGDKQAKVADLARWWMERFDSKWQEKMAFATGRISDLVVIGEWERRWGHWPVWCVTWVRDPTHQERLLARQPREGESAYTRSPSRALTNAGEAVDEEAQAEFCEAASDHIEKQTKETAAAKTAEYERGRRERDERRSRQRAAARRTAPKSDDDPLIELIANGERHADGSIVITQAQIEASS